MEKDYTKENLADGSVKLSFSESTLSAHQGLLTQWALTGGILIFVGALTLTTVVLFKGNALGWVFTIFIALAAVFLFVKFITKKNFIVISANGLAIGRQQNTGSNYIAYEDIDEMGVITLTQNAQVHVETAYIYLYAGGRELRLTGHITKALANALLKEINKARAQLENSSVT